MQKEKETKEKKAGTSLQCLLSGFGNSQRPTPSSSAEEMPAGAEGGAAKGLREGRPLSSCDTKGSNGLCSEGLVLLK